MPVEDQKAPHNLLEISREGAKNGWRVITTATLIGSPLILPAGSINVNASSLLFTDYDANHVLLSPEENPYLTSVEDDFIWTPPTYNLREAPIKNSELERGMILSPRQAWSTRFWFPFFPETARGEDLPRLHDDWWIFHTHDLLNWQLYQRASFTLAWGRKEAKDFIDKYQNDTVQVSSAGNCLELAIVQALEEYPGEGKEFQGKWYDEAYLIGLLIVKHKGDRLARVPINPDSIRVAIERGKPVVVDLPEKPGNWWRVVNGISKDGEWVQVTNFGFPDQTLPFNDIKEAFVPIHEDSLYLDPSRTTKVRSRVPGLNVGLINWVVYGQ